jgi:uncharacterized membrane protein YraQ (UPF0718 family)/YHS domain-containing protein
MGDVLSVLWHGVRDGLLMGWQIWWALAFGFFISAVVQAWVPRELIQSRLGDGAEASAGDGGHAAKTAQRDGGGVRDMLAPLALATGLGAASSSCSYAATAIAKSLFQKGASATNAIAFQIASTNLVWELGFVLWVLIGWRFTLAEYVGGIVMILLMAAMFRRVIPATLEDQARKRARLADTGHEHHMAGETMPLRTRLTSVSAWSDVAHNFRGDWQMLYREIAIGLLISGFVAQLDHQVFHAVFLSGSPALVRAVWGALIGPVIAMLTFVCSVGNVPLAAVLWRGGASFAGVIAFLFADLVIPPLIVIYRKYYGGRFTVRLVGLLLVAMVGAALIVQALFGLAGLIPSAGSATRSQLFSGVHANYTLVLNALGLALSAALLALTARRGATDPVCGMIVDRAKAVSLQHAGRTLYFCCDGCRDAFVKAPDRYGDGSGARTATVHVGRHGNPKHHTISLPESGVHRHGD